MTPMNLLEEVTNLLSLALRVIGNIFAGEVMASMLVLLSHQPSIGILLLLEQI